MTDFLNSGDYPWLLPSAGALLVVLVAALILWLRYRRRGSLEGAIAEIAFERIDRLVIPSADEGEILIDHLLLTSQGLLILDVKNVQGTIFGGDKLKEWSVIADDRRYTFPNPQTTMFDRIAALYQIVRDVPVTGRIVFLDGGEFPKGVPELVTSLEELVFEFAESDKEAADFNIEAYKPHWDLVRKEALDPMSG